MLRCCAFSYEAGEFKQHVCRVADVSLCSCSAVSLTYTLDFSRISPEKRFTLTPLDFHPKTAKAHI